MYKKTCKYNNCIIICVELKKYIDICNSITYTRTSNRQNNKIYISISYSKKKSPNLQMRLECQISTIKTSKNTFLHV